MTREEALEQLDYNSMSSMSYMLNQFLINDIFNDNDFESRTCENCTQKHNSMCIDMRNAQFFSNEEWMHMQIKDTFGCNRFERKDT